MARGDSSLETPNPGRWRMIAGFAVLLALAVFVLVMWFVFQDDKVTGDGGGATSVPVVRAPDGPDRQRPDEPGGAPVPDRDKSVFETFNRDGDNNDDVVERLLPAPESALPDTVPPARPDSEIVAADADAEPDTSAVIDVSERPAPVPPPDDATTETATGAAKPAQSIADLVARTEQKLAETAPAKPVPSKSAPSESAPTKPAPASSAAASGDWQAQLAAFRDDASARQAWDTARGKWPDLLERMTPDIVRADLGDRGIYYRLRTGDFASKQAAESFCKGLVAKGQGCIAAKR
ncbi:MAG: SPOR domain-containing protein [Minwuia sp.]|nr:SPOR domain-containing protein [Minwuia sp.]